MRLLDYMLVLLLIFWGTSIMFSVVALPIYIPINNAHRFLFFHILNNTWFFLCFWWLPLLQVLGNISLWFWLVFPWWSVLLDTSSCTCWPFACFPWVNVYAVPLSFFLIALLCFFSYWVLWVHYIYIHLEALIPYYIDNLKISFLIL